MIHLYGKVQEIIPTLERLGVLTVTANASLPKSLARTKALVYDGDKPPTGYKVILHKKLPAWTSDCPQYLLPEELTHLNEGDIVSVNVENLGLRVLMRKASNHNSILLTEQCNHYCLMCSQPPKNADDSWLLDEAMEVVRQMPSSTREIGFTGGEPTLYGDRFIELMSLVKSYLPKTSIHILTNGRKFHDIEFTRKYARIQHQDMMLGIPIYSDDPVTHDYVVQSKNAFNETIRGILNLKSLGQKVEIRVVLHKQTIDRLIPLVEFITRNLLFVDHVALMGLEITGFTRANLDALWIDPFDYKEKLSDAVSILRSYDINASVYNLQRCLVNDDILPAYRKSISDWKNEYLDVCSSCFKLDECGGLFTSQLRYKYSNHIKPFIINDLK